MKKIISNLKIYRIYLYLLIIVIVYFYSVNFTYANKVRVVDGDTIHINNIKYRLHGIDAPEIKQHCQVNGQKYNCGVQSKNFLESLIENKEITCKQKNIDKYKRIIATCYIEELNLNKEMVKSGWAIAYRYYSKKYINDEYFAQKNKLGMWQGSFLEPRKWRKKNKK